MGLENGHQSIDRRNSAILRGVLPVGVVGRGRLYRHGRWRGEDGGFHPPYGAWVADAEGRRADEIRHLEAFSHVGVVGCRRLFRNGRWRVKVADFIRPTRGGLARCQ